MTEIETFKDYKERIEQTYENMKEDGEEDEWFVIEGKRIKDYSMSVDDARNAITMGCIGWTQSIFKEGADVRTLWGTHDVFTTKLLVHKDDLSDEALEKIRENEEQEVPE